MNIERIRGREIVDSRGIPTVECELLLDDGSVVSASVPSGVSRGKYEAVELRDGGSRLQGMGVLKAVETIEKIIGPKIVGQEPNVVAMDMAMIEMDGTDNKALLGANSMLAVSAAVLKAQAAVVQMPIFELVAQLCEFQEVSLPFPMFNLINGGAHANNGLVMQEFMITPLTAQSFKESLHVSLELFHTIKALLRVNNFSTAVGDEGGFAPFFSSDQEALDIIVEACVQVDPNKQYGFSIALDVAASQLYNSETNRYRWADKELSSSELINFYKDLVAAYPIYSIEDGLDQDDWEGWQSLMEHLGSQIQIVGDDLFVTNPYRIAQGIERSAATAAIIKPNQIGTITEALQSIKLCKEHAMDIIIAHRSGDTVDTLIADLAVGTSAGQIKAGGLSRGERVTKYNHLLALEELLISSVV